MGGHNDDALAAAIVAVAKTGPDRSGVWRHRKGGVYRVVCCAVRESDMVPVVVYQCEYPQGALFDRKLAVTWVRPLAEFVDGRFTMVTPPEAA